ncbi:polysaccharide biosynthesis/export family protein, partial [Acidomonas methanolica]|uniref:polysaccharide biosynthesis/export family protein n=1 Tax=Acidomonas methanolica TaxID=437 RepID=UPI002232640B
MPTSRRNLLLALSAGVLLAGCAPGSGLEPVPPYDPAQYRLGTDDEVRVITYGQDQLTGDFRIDSAGRIDLPLLGDIRAAGLTTPELADQIRAGLRQKGILRDADVAGRGAA